MNGPGRAKSTLCLPCPCPGGSRRRDHALNDGERMARTAEGLAVMHVVADDETGEVSAIAVLARHGEIPEEFEEQIRAL
jgi:hypothetical protein